ncbi:Lrp/AsnC family transcriptional regulator [Candidatus Woesearchaeota archaeon]|nr:Lrp/AsnC family transcriptional regulator [Candidatus Woesearchaeota archaeon]
MEQIKLDLKDKKLLFELDFDARVSYSQLAKKLDLSKQGVEYKLNNLMKRGIIKGFYTVVNVPKLGYLYCRIIITLQNVNPEKENEILDYVIKNPRFFWVFTTQGVYDLLIVMWAKNITELKNAVDDLVSRFGQYIKYKNETLTTDVIHYQHRYLLGIKPTKEIHIKETQDKLKIDETDKNILRLIVDNARIPLVEISRALKINPKVIANRINKMKKLNLIEGYRPIINHNILGYSYYKLWINLNNITKDKLVQLKNHIKNNPIVLYIVEGISMPGDLDIEIMVKTSQELFDFVKDLRSKFPTMIGDYKTFMFYETRKVRYLPF